MKSKIQIFVENSVLSFLTIIKIVLLSRFFLKKHKNIIANKDCLILGNSPSLEETIKNNPKFIENKDLFAVNFFWKSELFPQLKPLHFVILSSTYWAKNRTDNNEASRKATFDEIAKIVTWKMFLYVPALAKKHKTWKIQLEKNSNVTIVYFNPTPIEGFECLNNFFFRTGLGMPRPHNVIIPSLIFAINSKYSNIYLIGAEHSWLKDIWVADDNEVLLTLKHFYDINSPKPEAMLRGTTSEKRTLGEVLTKFVHTFNSYFVIKYYAKSRNVKIFNATKNSYIDAFERVKI